MRSLNFGLILQLLFGFLEAKKQGKVEIITLYKPKLCEPSAKTGDFIKVHYVAKFKNGTVFDEGTEKVGRPLELKLGVGAAKPGWDEGLEGMCLKEKRRLVVPPSLTSGAAAERHGLPQDTTVVFDVELIVLNRESPISSRSHAAIPEELLCDSCLLMVEGFFERWTEMMSLQLNRATVQAGGDKPPAITYNDDMEAMVQEFCNSAPINSDRVAGFVQPACKEIMKVWKRDFVGHFLSNTVGHGQLPEKRAAICRDMVGVCHSLPDALPRGTCESCRATVDALAFELRTQGPLQEARGRKRQVWDTLDFICMKLHYRLARATKAQELCDDLVDEHGSEIVRMVEEGEPWAAVSSRLCGTLTGHCSTKEVEEL
uniref:peptidylprolyl isomerase n=1 Tax=Tetraselmis sp. GSL018 TaxID=582737 RepID=A0A061RUR4_9CHLO|eukprot:CAMPEP_0177619512 /NCGR_PEP_ID=MMETSP0419_2-20121207/26319_1 /TAXON_ID=582737 /ORGANISM="Tetraselmis sp., Strain GSL018" /LENGTH=371 /DNA_ID=CAMNT_0019118823 /DNA_START=62 /DNA_END=1177 /DNA_ORIENTATION=-